MRKGMTLMEIIVSIALFTIILATVPRIFGSTFTNIGKNGVDINELNTAKSELNVALSDPLYTGDTTDPSVSQENVYVEILGTKVKVRHIKSEVNGVEGVDFFAYMPYSPLLPEPPGGGDGGGSEVIVDDDDDLALDSLIFLDKDKDGYYNKNTDSTKNKDEIVDLSEGNYSYSGEGNLVVGENCSVNKNMNINVSDKIIIKEDVTLYSGGNGSITLDCDKLVLQENSKIDSQNSNVTVVTNGDVDLADNSAITCGGNGGIGIQSDNLNISNGASVSAQNGYCTVKATGDIVLDNRATLEAKNASVVIESCTSLKVDNNSNILGQNSAIKITSSGDINLNNGSSIQNGSGGINIYGCQNMYIDNSSLIKTQNNPINITANNDVVINNSSKLNVSNAINITCGNNVKILGGSELYGQNNSITLKALNAYVSGSSSKNTRFDCGGNGTVFDLSAGGKIYFGQQGDTNSFVVFNGGQKSGYAYNKNNVPFATDYVTPQRDSSNNLYFK